MTPTYGIDDGHGNSLTQGLSEHEARRAAQRLANARGEAVYLWEVGVQGAEEITPDETEDGD